MSFYHCQCLPISRRLLPLQTRIYTQKLSCPPSGIFFHEVHEEITTQYPPSEERLNSVLESLSVVGKTKYVGIRKDRNEWRLDLAVLEFDRGVCLETGVCRRAQLAATMRVPFDLVPSQPPPQFVFPVPGGTRWYHNGVSSGWIASTCLSETFELWLKASTIGTIESIEKARVLVFKSLEDGKRLRTTGDWGGGVYSVVRTLQAMRSQTSSLGQSFLVCGGLLVAIFTATDDGSFSMTMVVPGPVIEQQIKDGLNINGSVKCILKDSSA